jgi:aspartyl-tRNA(Asn)/glutamyl-tRNA(Gln) amidotransferase subunit B
VNDGNMEEGSLRCDANVSVRPGGAETLGTKAEVKNLNSFRFLQKALEHEIERQVATLTEGGRIVQETRLWDAAAGRTISMRSKEEAHDYRYFPEPDLPPVIVDADRLGRIRSAMPELPDARRRRFVEQFALADYDAGQLTQSKRSATTSSRSSPASPQGAANWLMGSVRSKTNGLGLALAGFEAVIAPKRLAELIAYVERGSISSSIAKDVFEKMFESGMSADDIVRADGLTQLDDESQIVALIADVLSKYADAAAQYRAGKTATFGFLVGQVMKAAAGKANPKRVNELLRKELAGAAGEAGEAGGAGGSG